MDAIEALKRLVELGADVVYKDFHIYKNRYNEFCVLTFTKKDNNQIPIDYTTTNVDEAISKFVTHTNFGA